MARGITLATARKIASDWHGGQFSPLYALASTGTVVDGVAVEVRYCLDNLSPLTYAASVQRERKRLTQLLKFVGVYEKRF